MEGFTTDEKEITRMNKSNENKSNHKQTEQQNITEKNEFG